MTRLRPARFDDLGLRRGLSDRLLPALVGAMAFLAALALAGALAASGLAQHWRAGAGAMLTVQVPQPADPATGGAGTRADRVLALLTASAAVEAVRRLSEDELAVLLQPWLGVGVGRLAVPLPAVLEVRLRPDGPDLGDVPSRAEAVAPGTLIDADTRWTQRLAELARSLEACAALAVAVVGFVAVAVIAVATRAGLAARRDAIETVHGLGATDSYIASRFARRTTTLAALGAFSGAIAALPVLAELTRLAAPLAGGPAGSSLGALPPLLWLTLPLLPVTAGAIGWLTAQGTVRRWLRRMP